MDYSLVALDMDGTLLTDQESISDRNLRALKKALRKGLHVVLATARTVWSARACLPEPDMPLGVVACNGAEVWLPGGREPLVCEPIPPDVAAALVRCDRPGALQVKLYPPERIHRSLERPELFDRFHSPGAEPGVPGPLLQVVFTGPDDQVRAFWAELEERYRHVLTFTTSEPGRLEITRHGVSKVTGLARLAQALGVPGERVVAMGNGANDLPMLEWAGLGFAMANAPEEVRRRVGRIAPRHDEDGVAQVIEALLQ